MLTLEWVSPDALHEHWAVIREGLEKVQKHGDNWMAEDVYLAIKTGTANLHIGRVESDYKGFIVTQQQAGYSGPILYLWACYSSERKEAQMLEQGMPELIKWAENIGSKRIRFSSPHFRL